MRRILLTYGCDSPTGEFAYVDDVDYELVSPFRWFMSRHRGKSIVRASLDTQSGRAVYLHRLVARAKPGEVAILVDGNPTNCTRRNVVVGRRDLVAAGRAPRRNKGNGSTCKGTTWRPRQGRWQARIRSDGRERSLGYFDTEAEAAAAYSEAAVAQFGWLADRSAEKTQVVRQTGSCPVASRNADKGPDNA